MRKLILSLIGHGGSGKTSAAKHLEEKYGFTSFTFSTVIREYAASNGIPLQKRSDYANTHAQILKRFGNEYMISRAINVQSDLLCIDDVRSPAYADSIHAASGKDIAFDCPVEVRFAHVREHPDKAKYPDMLDEFIRNEQEDEAITIGAGLKFETDSLLNSADYHIDASGSLENTLRQLDDIVEQLLN